MKRYQILLSAAIALLALAFFLNFTTGASRGRAFVSGMAAGFALATISVKNMEDRP